MHYPIFELEKLKKLLQKFHSEISLDYSELDVVGQIIFEGRPDFPFDDNDLLDTIFYLKELVRSKGFTGVDEIVAFYAYKKTKLMGFIDVLTIGTPMETEHETVAVKRSKSLQTKKESKSLISRIWDLFRPLTGGDKTTSLHWSERDSRFLQK